jgi:hypothetical protein
MNEAVTDGGEAPAGDAHCIAAADTEAVDQIARQEEAEAVGVFEE